MPASLPYCVATATGETLEFTFPLHPDTGSAVVVSQLLSALLKVLDNELKLHGEISNGDVLQAAAMALAVRARMIHAPMEQTGPLAAQLLETALEAADAALSDEPLSGRA